MGDISINLNPQVPAIPKFEDKTKIDVRYMVIEPYVSIHIYYDEKSGEVIYDVEEPLLSEADKANLIRIEEAMREVVDVSMIGENNTLEALIDYIDKTARLIISELGMSVEESVYKDMFYFLYRDFIGLNEIEPMMRDYFIEDLECNGMGDPMYIVHRVFRNLKTTVRGFSSNVPDYAMILIEASSGILEMTREHIILCMAYNIPFYIFNTYILSYFIKRRTNRIINPKFFYVFICKNRTMIKS